jgi:hypothetical protein
MDALITRGEYAGAEVVAACGIGVYPNWYAQAFIIFVGGGIQQFSNATWTPVTGDSVYLSIAHNSTTKVWVFNLNDITQGANYMTVDKVDYTPQLNTGWCATDMPHASNGAVDPSAKFSAVQFSDCLVDGQPLGTAPNGTTTYKIFNLNAAGTEYLAKPTTLTAKGLVFKVKFIATGP